jgi:rhodanese-related sulfurtransferase
MQKIGFALLLLATLAVPAFAQAPATNPGTSAAPAPGIKALTRAEFDALVATPERVLLLDVRRPDEVQKNGGFAAYFSVPLADLEKYLAFIPKDRAIVAISNHAHRAEDAARLLQRHGFTVAGVVGSLTYEEEGGTIVRVPRPGDSPK